MARADAVRKEDGLEPEPGSESGSGTTGAAAAAARVAAAGVGRVLETDLICSSRRRRWAAAR